MPTITITGPIGSGALEVGAMLSDELGIEYIDRLILSSIAEKIGFSITDIENRTERTQSFSEKIAAFAQSALERSALAGGGSDPYFGSGLDAVLIREYKDFPQQSTGDNNLLSDSNLMEVTSGVINELASNNNVIIAGRGANIILGERPNTYHFGLASSHKLRLSRIMQRFSVNEIEAERNLLENDQARIAYFKRFFAVDPNDPLYYHQIFNTDMLSLNQVTQSIVSLIKS